MASKFYDVLMVGGFPPPVHGMSAITDVIYRRLLREGVRVRKMDVSPISLSSSFFIKMARIWPFMKAWLGILSIARTDGELGYAKVYVALSGGWGMLFDLITITICRLKGVGCVLHHHSFSYFYKKSVLADVLFRVGGKGRLSHVVLCEEMSDAMKMLYPGSGDVIVLSNASLIHLEDMEASSRSKISTVGYLSNITSEKGGDIFINLAYASKKHGLPLRFIMAGPCTDEGLRSKINGAVAAGFLEWCGPVYGEKKADFWRQADVFVFPTKYRNEAEPLVLWEAFSWGTPVISFRRGCIATQMGDKGGVLLSKKDDFVNVSLAVLIDWLNPDNYSAASKSALDRYIEAQTKSQESWVNFLIALGVDHKALSLQHAGS